MKTVLSQSERAYYVRKLGGAHLHTESLNNIKRAYWENFLSKKSNTPLGELELQWILKVLENAAIVPARQGWLSDLWKQMVVSVSGIPAKNIKQNKLTFFLLAP
jgi:hypothetical protein